MRSWIHRRGPLCAYLMIVAVSIILLSIATKPIINRYVSKKVEEVLRTERVCREGALDETKACRALIDRVTRAATIKQEHTTAIRLFRTLTAKEIRELGLEGPRGPRGRQGPRGTTRIIRITLPGRVITITKTVPGKPGPRGPEGPAGPPGPGETSPEPGATGPTQNNPPGPAGNKNNPSCPPRNPHCR